MDLKENLKINRKHNFYVETQFEKNHEERENSLFFNDYSGFHRGKNFVSVAKNLLFFFFFLSTPFQRVSWYIYTQGIFIENAGHADFNNRMICMFRFLRNGLGYAPWLREWLQLSYVTVCIEVIVATFRMWNGLTTYLNPFG